MKSQAHIRNQLESADLEGELISCLLSIDKRVRRLECGSILSELHNAGRISLTSNVNLLAIESLEHNEFWLIIHSLDKAIPELECSYKEILKFVQTLVIKAGSDGAAGMPELSLIKWCSANPKQANVIVANTIDLDPDCLSHCVFAIQGLGDEGIAFKLLNHKDPAVVSVGLRSLGRLAFRSVRISKRIVDECFKRITDESEQDVRLSAIQTAFKTWERKVIANPYRQKEFIQAIISANNDLEIIELSSMLFYYKKCITAVGIDQILTALGNEISDAQTVLAYLDLAIGSKNDKWKLASVIKVFETLIPRVTGPIDAAHFVKFCEWIRENPRNMSLLYSRWLMSGEFSLCSFLADMSTERGKNTAPIEIFKSDIPTEVDDQIFMVRKCIGFLIFNEITAASILLSVVKNGKKLARKASQELLFDPLILSYGGDLHDFLTSQTKNLSKRVSKCTTNILKQHDLYISGLEETKHLVEFNPTIEQRRAAASKEFERHKNMQDQVHEKSIFSQICTRETLLYGNKSFTVIHGGDGTRTPSILPLSELSHSIELPRLSVFDPVGFAEMLSYFRFERRAT